MTVPQRPKIIGVSILISIIFFFLATLLLGESTGGSNSNNTQQPTTTTTESSRSDDSQSELSRSGSEANHGKRATLAHQRNKAVWDAKVGGDHRTTTTLSKRSSSTNDGHSQPGTNEEDGGESKEGGAAVRELLMKRTAAGNSRTNKKLDEMKHMEKKLGYDVDQRSASIDVPGLHKELRHLGMPQCALDYFEADYLRKEGVKRSILRKNNNHDENNNNNPHHDSPTTTVTSSSSPTSDPLDSAQPFLKESQEKLWSSSGLDHIFMVHYTPLVKRRHKMATFLKIHGVTAEWVTGFDKQNITSEVRKCFVDSWKPAQDFPENRNKQKRERSIKERGLTIDAQVSVVTKHHSAIYAVVRGGYRNALILEDDALLRRNFLPKMKAISEELEEIATLSSTTTTRSSSSNSSSQLPTTSIGSSSSAVDVVMIGGCLKMHAWRKKFAKGTRRLSKHLFERQEARCAHAYMVTAQGAKLLLAGIPLTSAIDFQLNQVIRENNIRCAWVEPFLSIQGKLDDQCVTALLGPGAKCPTSGKRDRDSTNFDVENADSAVVDSMWETVPDVGSALK